MFNLSSFRHMLMFAPVVLLAACAQNPGNTAFKEAPASTAPGGKAAAAAGGVPRSAPAPVGVNEPARLKGLTPVQVAEILGQPGFQRHDSPAEIWQYRGHACILDVYIYDQGHGQAVEHWAVRSMTRVNDSDCFQQLVEQGHTHPGS